MPDEPTKEQAVEKKPQPAKPSPLQTQAAAPVPPGKKKGGTQIPNTQRKLREAQFFLSHLSKAGRSPELDSEVFDYYLSAFLSAGRSVTLFLQCEQKASYDSWFPNWFKALSEDERKLLRFSNDQRVAAVHTHGAETQSAIEMVPLIRFETEYRPNNISWMVSGWFDSPGAPPTEMEIMVYHFEMDGKKEKAVDVCSRYLVLLEKLVRGFDQSFPH